MKLLLDTSCLVSYFMMDAHYARARRVLEQLMAGEIQGMISVLSWVELCGVIRRNTSAERAGEVKGKMLDLMEKGLMDWIPLTIADAVSSGELAVATGLKGADAIIVNAAMENNAKLFTFDEEIKKKAKNKVEFFE